MVFWNGLKNIQAAAYNGGRTVLYLEVSCQNDVEKQDFFQFFFLMVSIAALLFLSWVASLLARYF